MSECGRKGKLFKGCNFQPRYSIGPAISLTKEQIDALSAATVWSEDYVDCLKTMTKGSEKYEGEICIRCGVWRAPSGI